MSTEPSLILNADEVVAHLAGVDETRVMGAYGHNYIALDDYWVIVEGRVSVRRVGGASTIARLSGRWSSLSQLVSGRVREAEARLAGLRPRTADGTP